VRWFRWLNSLLDLIDRQAGDVAASSPHICVSWSGRPDGACEGTRRLPVPTEYPPTPDGK